MLRVRCSTPDIADVREVFLSPTGHRLICLGLEERLLIDTAKGNIIAKLFPSEEMYLRSIPGGFSADGSIFAVCKLRAYWFLSESQDIFLCSSSDGSIISICTQRSRVSDYSFLACSFSKNGEQLWAISSHDDIVCFDVATGRPLSVASPPKLSPLHIIPGFLLCAYGSFRARNEHAIIYRLPEECTDNSSFDDFDCVAASEGISYSELCVCSGTGSEFVVVGGVTGKRDPFCVSVIDPISGTTVKRWHAREPLTPPHPPKWAQATLDGNWLFTVGRNLTAAAAVIAVPTETSEDDRELRLWDLQRGLPYGILARNKEIHAVSADGRVLVTRTRHAERGMTVWDVDLPQGSAQSTLAADMMQLRQWPHTLSL